MTRNQVDDQKLLERHLKRLERFRLMDDTFMRQVFKDNLPLVQHTLRIMTGIRDLELRKSETQRDLKRLAGSKSIVLDVWGSDSLGNHYNIEVQTGSNLEPRRFRYYGSGMDVESLHAGQEYSDLPERWQVVVLERDPDGPTRRMRDCCMREEDGRVLGDGAHLRYINAQWRGSDELGSLMADFCQSDPTKIKDDGLRSRVEYLKRDTEGIREMCRISEEIYNEGLEEGRAEGLEEGRAEGLELGQIGSIRQLTANLGWTAQRALEAIGIPKADWDHYLALL